MVKPRRKTLNSGSCSFLYHPATFQEISLRSTDGPTEGKLAVCQFADSSGAHIIVFSGRLSA